MILSNVLCITFSKLGNEEQTSDRLFVDFLIEHILYTCIMYVSLKNLTIVPVGEWIHPRELILSLKCFFPFQWGPTLKGKKLLLLKQLHVFTFNSTPLI